MVSKYSKSHTIVLGGDFNASLHREPPNNIDKMLRDCCSEAGLTTPDNYPVKPTFYHHDNKSSSQIDYLFTLKDQIKDGIGDRPFNLKRGGGVMVFCFVQNFVFGQHKS